jgi:hypothetical protein
MHESLVGSKEGNDSTFPSNPRLFRCPRSPNLGTHPYETHWNLIDALKPLQLVDISIRARNEASPEWSSLVCIASSRTR